MSPSPSPPSSSPSPSSASSKEVIISNFKPKSCHIGDPQTSASVSASSTATRPPPEKRTREQANFYDCHSCGRRINHTNPKDRLQPLDSFWRIVLLCRKCRKNLHLGKLCPYCFKETANAGNLFTCGVCGRTIHEVCVGNYGSCMPWCYLGVQLKGLRTCLDCWVPQSLKNSLGGSGSSENKGGLEDKDETNGLLGKVEKKVKFIGKAKKMDVGRAQRMKSEVDLANGISVFEAKRHQHCSKADDSNFHDTVHAVDDGLLTLKLHKPMNSSSRNFTSKCLVNDKALDGSNGKVWKGFFYERSRLRNISIVGQNHRTAVSMAENELISSLGVNGWYTDVHRLHVGRQTYVRDRKRKVWQLDDVYAVLPDSRRDQPAKLEFSLRANDFRTSFSMRSVGSVSGASNRVNKYRSMSGVDFINFEKALLTYKRTRFKQKERQVKRGVGASAVFVDNKGLALKSDYCQVNDANRQISSLIKSENKMIFPSASCDAEQKRYFLKYGKRVRVMKSVSSVFCYSTYLHEDHSSALVSSDYEAGNSAKSDGVLMLPDGTGNYDPDHSCFIKYAKRVRSSKSVSEANLHLDACLNKVEALAPGLTANWSGESRTGTCDPDQSYMLKYTKRLRSPKSISEAMLHTDACVNEIEVPTPGLTVNQSEKTRTGNCDPDHSCSLKCAMKVQSSKSTSEAKLHPDACLNEI